MIKIKKRKWTIQIMDVNNDYDTAVFTLDKPESLEDCLQTMGAIMDTDRRFMNSDNLIIKLQEIE